MDYVCEIDQFGFAPDKVAEEIAEKGCERNMILSYLVIVTPAPRTNINPAAHISLETYLLRLSSKWCRFDRNRDIKEKSFSCVLYDTKPRTLKE